MVVVILVMSITLFVVKGSNVFETKPPFDRLFVVIKGIPVSISIVLSFVVVVEFEEAEDVIVDDVVKLLEEGELVGAVKILTLPVEVVG
mmetsp:Transcript_22435/g.37999  ORF Transcript_22435/g.37999 Transcript_22435/m.37999 type:complete len:89 (-) Transcript_22435:447-713(-)